MIAALVVIIVPLSSTASAQGKPSKGNPHNVVTEDNDHDGVPNNIPDSGDNAHPSGKDRSVEHGKSGNQGNAQSDPDDDGRGPDRSNGGIDQPGGTGGVDKVDQDGNNGCGNDDDFEDDNEGWCGHKPHNDPPVVPPVVTPPPDVVVPPQVIVRPPLTPTRVSSVTALPRTGTEVSVWLLVAIILIVGGWQLWYIGRRRTK